MKSTGVTIPLDNLGRIVLPIELRRTLQLTVEDRVEIFVEKDMVILRKYVPTEACVFCGECANVKKFKDKYICPDCASQIKR